MDSGYACANARERRVTCGMMYIYTIQGEGGGSMMYIYRVRVEVV